MDYEEIPEIENQPEPPMPPSEPPMETDGQRVARETVKQIQAERNGEEMTPESPTSTPQNRGDLTPAIKSDTSEILSLMTPGEKADPLLPLVEELVELTLRLEDKVDNLTTELTGLKTRMIDAGTI